LTATKHNPGPLPWPMAKVLVWCLNGSVPSPYALHRQQLQKKTPMPLTQPAPLAPRVLPIMLTRPKQATVACPIRAFNLRRVVFRGWINLKRPVVALGFVALSVVGDFAKQGPATFMHGNHA